jgi:PKD repeat protein
MNAVHSFYTKRFVLRIVFLSATMSLAATRHVALNGGHTPPFDTWAKAATNIQTAVDAALAGDEVLVSNGVYATGVRVTPGATTSNRVVIAKAIHVRSLHGPGATMIMGSGPNIYNAVRCAYVAEGGILSGFTLTNGHTLNLPPTAVRGTDTDGGGALLGPAGCVSNCVLAGNACVQYGGGACGLTNSELTHCVIVGNQAVDGGGVCTTTGAVVRNCVIEANTATSDGGGVYCDFGGLVRNCLVTRNRAANAGVYCMAGGAIESCTIARNVCGGGAFDADGLFLSYGGSVRNSIVYYNLPGRDFKYYGSFVMTYCCIPGVSAAGSNIIVAPQFMDLTNGNLRLQASSPCINRGGNDAWHSTAQDLDGRPRVVNDIVDMGAYEAGAWQCDVVANVRTGLAPLSVQLSARVSGTNAVGVVYAWDFSNDGVIDQAGTAAYSVATVYTTGLYSVRLLVSNVVGDVAQTIKTNMILALPPLAADFTADRTSGPTPLTVQFSDLSGNVPQVWRWDLDGNGTVDSTAQHPSFSYTSAGVYSVSLSVSNNFGVGGASFASITKTNLISVSNAVHMTHYAGVAGAHVAPFISWSDAATNIQDAVDAASPGELVLVADGVYCGGYRRAPAGDSGARVSVAKPVTVQSVNGPGATMILGGGYPNDMPVRGAFLSNGAALCGFTISNGVTSTSDNLSFDQHGGGVYMGWNALLSNCVLVACRAMNAGGGAYCQGTSLVVACTMAGNTAMSGGGVWCGPGTLRDCRIENNKGGGVRATVTLIERCVVRGNTSSGLRLDNMAVVRHCVIVSNTSDFGGGVYVNNGATVENCAIMDNEASNSGGGFYSWIGSILRGCTVIGNRARNYGGGVRFVFASGYIENSILYHNIAPFDANHSLASITVRYTCTTPALSGIGNLTNDPGVVALLNPHLGATSPCINAGTNTVVVTADIDGEPRVLDGRVDIGCDEYLAAGITGALRVAIAADYTNIAAGYALPLAAHIDGKAHTAVWDFGDGGRLTNVAAARHAWAVPGTYAVRLTAWNNERMAAATAMIVVAAAATNYVALGAGHVPPYHSWAMAATSVQAAVAAALPGNTVLIGGGTHVLPSAVAITKQVTLVGALGAAGVILQGTGADRCLTVACLDPVTLDGLTISNGVAGNAGDGGGIEAYGDLRCLNCVFGGNRADGFGGGLRCEMGGTISNCHFVGNTAERGGGLYAEARQTVLGSVFAHNTAGLGGGAVLDAYVSASNCHVYGNSGSGLDCTSATVVDSVISNNHGAGYGGGVDMFLGTVEGCLIRGNSAGAGGGMAVNNGTVTRCVVDGNSASSQGAGVLCESSAAIAASSITGNVGAAKGGGAYFAGGDSGVINGSLLGHNQAQEGGGVYFYSGGLVMFGTVASNRADIGGGAVFRSGGTMSNTLVVGNQARQGGGAYTATSYGNIFTSKLHDNMAGEQGGGLYATVGGIFVRSSELIGNTASNAGGGAYWLNAYSWMWLDNCSVAGNRAAMGGGVYAAGAGTLMNTIVYHNDGGDFTNTGTSATVRYSCLPVLISGDGNIINAPQFKNLAARDMRLQDASSCMDTGTNMPWMPTALDLGGRPRRIGPQADMGAYEATRGALLQLTPRTYVYLIAATGATASGSVRLDNMGRAALTGEVLGVGWPFAIEAGSPAAYVIGSEASTAVVFRYDPLEEGWTNIPITFTGGGGAAFMLYGESYIPEPASWGVLGLFTMYNVRFTIWQRRRREQ